MPLCKDPIIDPGLDAEFEVLPENAVVELELGDEYSDSIVPPFDWPTPTIPP